MPARPSAANRAPGGARPAADGPPAEPAGGQGAGPAPAGADRGGGRGGSFWAGLGSRRILGLSPAGLIIAAATLLAVGLRAYQLARPGHLLAATEYDDGADFGSALRLVGWAIVPVAVIAVLCLPGTRRLLAFAGGVAAGFLIPVVPYALAAPARFWNSVIVAQLVRTDVRIPFGYRVQQMAGLAVGHPATA